MAASRPGSEILQLQHEVAACHVRTGWRKLWNATPIRVKKVLEIANWERGVDGHRAKKGQCASASGGLCSNRPARECLVLVHCVKLPAAWIAWTVRPLSGPNGMNATRPVEAVNK